ncbi:response regulator [bacterium]|nr:MAG: response regulator [bacterium]
MKVLIVDDDISVRSLFREFFKMKGFEVLEAQDGHEAMRKLHETEPDLIILDMKMGRMSGLEVLEKIRELFPHIPVIVCTAYKHLKMDVDLVSLGKAYFLTKPVDFTELNNLLIEIFPMMALNIT